MSSSLAGSTRIGFVFQNSDVQVFSPTVREDVAFGPLTMGLDRDDVETRLADVLALLEISELADVSAVPALGRREEASSIVSVLVMNPEVLLFDEPTAALDPRTQQWLVELIVELNTAGKTIVFATHDLSTLEVIVDRCVVFSERHEVLADAPVDVVLGNRELLGVSQPRARAPASTRCRRAFASPPPRPPSRVSKQPRAPGVDAFTGTSARRDDGCLGVDRAEIGEEQIEVEVEVWEQVDLVDHHHIDRPKHHRILERLLLAFGDGVHHRPRVLADVKLGRADQVADVLDDQQVELVERKAGETGTDHDRVEVAFAAETGARVHERDLSAETVELVGVDAGRDVALEHPDLHRVARARRACAATGQSSPRPVPTSG